MKKINHNQSCTPLCIVPDRSASLHPIMFACPFWSLIYENLNRLSRLQAHSILCPSVCVIEKINSYKSRMNTSVVISNTDQLCKYTARKCYLPKKETKPLCACLSLKYPLHQLHNLINNLQIVHCQL